METYTHDRMNGPKIMNTAGVTVPPVGNDPMDIMLRRQEKRRAIWQINDFYYCATIGTCLTLSEQKKILAKEKCDPGRYTPYEIHCVMISQAKSENRISRRMNTLLNHKYREEIREFSGCDERVFLPIWNKRLAEGKICGLYWVAVTNKHFSDAMLARLFGDVHMLSHINGGEIRSSLQEAVRIKEENTQLKDTLRREKKTRKEMMKNLYVLEKNLTIMENKYRAAILESSDLTAQLTGDSSRAQIERLAAENASLREQLVNSEERVKTGEASIASLEDERDTMQLEAFDLREKNDHLTREFHDTIQQFFAIYQECDESCPAFDLCKKRILIVGGITKMKNLYRDLIEHKGGVFAYHDGYMRGGENVLEEKVRQSDVVLCPVDVNSHNACLSVKKICKKREKPYWMLPNSSLTSITQSLMRVVARPEGASDTVAVT